MHGRAKGTNHLLTSYWPWAVFFKILKFRQGSGPEWDDVLTLGSLKVAQDVCKYITSKRIELESPTTSQIRDNLKIFSTVI